MIRRFPLIATIPLLAAFFAPPAFAGKPALTAAARKDRCAEVVASIRSEPIETLDDLFRAFANGLLPDLDDPGQRTAFEVYRKQRFGNPTTSLAENTTDEIAKTIRKYPELEKEPFRAFHVALQEKVFPVPASLADFLAAQSRSAGQVRADLFQVDANAGFWRKILQYEDPPALGPPPADKPARKAYQKAAAEAFAVWFETRVPRAVRESFVDPKLSARQRIANVYRILARERAALAKAGKNARPISQAIADLVHTAGFHDPVILRELKSAEGTTRIAAYRRALEERDVVAMELGFADHFEGLLKALEVNQLAGVEDLRTFAARVNALEQETIAGGKIAPGLRKKTVRPLSLVEAPYRSCLGGSDCSSRTYLLRALDPDYHYFTLTDEASASSGHATIVLGTARTSTGASAKVAFVDKVQNVPDADIPTLFEGVRRSVAEQGYTLVLPKDLGDHNGISNESVTRAFIAAKVPVDRRKSFTGFAKRSNRYAFPNQYSRIDRPLELHPVLPLVSDDLALVAGDVPTPWRTSEIEVRKMIAATVDLKNGGVADKLRYMSLSRLISDQKLDPGFDGVLEAWMKDPTQPASVRRTAVLTLWTERGRKFAKLFADLSAEDQAGFTAQILETPRYAQRIAASAADKADLYFANAKNPALRARLRERFFPKSGRDLDLLLDSGIELSGRGAEVLRRVAEGQPVPNLERAVRIAKELHGTGLDDSALTLYTDPDFGWDAVSQFDFEVPYDHYDTLIAIAHHAERGESIENLPIVRALREARTHLASRGLPTAIEENGLLPVFADPAIGTEIKAALLRDRLTSGGYTSEFLAAIPRNQLDDVWRIIDRTSMIRLFIKLNDQGGPLRGFSPYRNGSPLAHEFVPIVTEAQAKSGGVTFNREYGGRRVKIRLTEPFEMQVTPLTQIHEVILFHAVRSKSRGPHGGLGFGDTGIRLHTSHALDGLSGDEERRIVETLSALDPEWDYRLPTANEWEYATLGGSDETIYSLKDREIDPKAHTESRSDGLFKAKGHDPALGELPANGFGLHDMRGVILQTTTEENGTGRIFRGGTAENPNVVQNAGSETRSNQVGLRLVRTKKKKK